MARDELTDRRDFGRLDEALAFITSRSPLGSRHTAWVIAGGRLVARADTGADREARSLATLLGASWQIGTP